MKTFLKIVWQNKPNTFCQSSYLTYGLIRYVSVSAKFKIQTMQTRVVPIKKKNFSSEFGLNNTINVCIPFINQYAKTNKQTHSLLKLKSRINATSHEKKFFENFINVSFDKGRLKILVSWFLKNYG